ncbi:hypothetical protein G4Y79_20575 [Phototrophicus methaneseepsis]|uniref:Translation initiation factor beta propellor-like domain-containing protein n=1 Tax=Phototrophicus methaneseepsis TaxID=2710758 RepID=A0A7S8E823_9CHLR|nr:hypothetical protein [Phototrophicus methaneseepsis]QPC82055.1 hypothetical protein G4Y79_20575 [Phototrophicus methaneseepsis]
MTSSTKFGIASRCVIAITLLSICFSTTLQSVHSQVSNTLPMFVEWSPDGSMIAVGGKDSYCNVESGNFNSDALRILDVDTRQLLYSIPDITCDILAMAWSPDSTQIIFGASGNDGVRIWDVVNQIYHPDFFYPGTVQNISWQPSGSLVVVGDGKGDISIVDTVTGSITQQFPGAGTSTYSAWNPEGSLLALTVFPYDLVILDIASFTELARMEVEQGTVSYLDWSKSGDVISAYSKQLEIINGSSFAPIISIMPENILPDFALSPNGVQIAGVGPLDGIHIWDTHTGELITTTDQEGIYGLDWSPDGSQLAYVPSPDLQEIISFLDINP